MAGFREGEAGDVDAFVAGGVTGGDGDGAARQAEGFSEEGAEFCVGFAFDGRGVELDLERVAKPADDLVAWGVGDGFDGEQAGVHDYGYGTQSRKGAEHKSD